MEELSLDECLATNLEFQSWFSSGIRRSLVLTLGFSHVLPELLVYFDLFMLYQVIFHEGRPYDGLYICAENSAIFVINYFFWLKLGLSTVGHSEVVFCKSASLYPTFTSKQIHQKDL